MILKLFKQIPLQTFPYLDEMSHCKDHGIKDSNHHDSPNHSPRELPISTSRDSNPYAGTILSTLMFSSKNKKISLLACC